MSVEDRAKQLNSLADKIRSSFTNFNSQFKSISDKRKRLARNIAERKERRSKLKSSTSSFGRSIGKISSNVLKTPGDIFGKVISFASLFLLGVLVNTIPKREQQLDSDLNKTKDKSEKVGNFFTGMVSAVQEFIGAFDRDKKTMDNTLDGIKDSSKEAEKEFNKLNNIINSSDVDLSQEDNSSSEQNNKSDDSTDDVENIFKKKNSLSASALKRDDKIQDNYEKVSKLLMKNDGYLVRGKELKDGEDIVEFTRRDVINKVIKKSFDQDRLNQIVVDDLSTEDTKIIILRQQVLTD